MKKTICIVLIFMLLLSMSVPFAAGAECDQKIFFDDGSYLIITVTEVRQARASQTISGEKSGSKYDTNGNLLWTVTLSGTFSYTYGVSASCTSANITASIYESSWSCASKNAYASGSSAIGSASMVRRVLGVQTDSVPVSLTLTCDKYGRLS